VDVRTDIWAFGCVLYEMLTARPAFEGETVTDIVAKIVTSGPDLELLPKDTPPSIRLLLSSLLNKNASQRLQHIGDARLFLDGTLAPATSVRGEGIAEKSRMPGKLAIAALLLALAVLAVPAVLYFRKAPVDAPLMRFDLVTPGTGMPALSPDGQTIAYITATDGKRTLWVRPIGVDVGRQVAGTEDLSGFLWSPDSKKIAFIAQNKLQKVDLMGGSPQFLGSIGQLLGADWSRAGVILMGRAKDNVIVKISDSGGEITPVTKLDEKRQESIHALPVFLPDGNHFLYVAAGPKMEEAGIFWASLSPGESPTRVVKLAPNRFNGMAYVEPNHLLYSNDGKLIVQNLSRDGRTVQGDPFTIAEDIEGNFTVSNNGLLTFRKAAPVTRKQLLWFSHDGKPMGQLDVDANYGNLDISPKGDRVAIDKVTDNNRDIWVIDLQRLVPQRVTFDAGADWSPVWSPDGSRLMFAASRSMDTVNRILEKSSTGAGDETRIDVGNTSSIPVNWSLDGQYLTYSRMRANGNSYDMWVLSLSGDRTPRPFLESTFDRIQARISPDSKYVAYSTNESGTFQIVVQTFPDPNGGKWQISGEGGVEPKWRRDGKELYYLALDGKMMAVPITAAASFNAGKPATLFQTSLAMTRNNPARDRRYDVAPDGRFLMVVPMPGGAPLPTTVLVNWEAALKK
jgi:Tol biopolymer transport system component